MKIRNVISVFDGMSCGQLALTKQGIEFDNYYASEIDKPAQVVSKANFPNTIYIGDVRKVNPDDYENVDLFIGGSPCQKFSFAGTMAGMVTKDEIEITTLEHYLELKAKNFEFEGQSYLFWEYMRILTGLKKKNPNIKFLLENVLMTKKWKKILTEAIGISPIMINSDRLSAQTRKRLYWTNIGCKKTGLFELLSCQIKTPSDKKIFLNDIIQKNVDEKYYLSEERIKQLPTIENNCIRIPEATKKGFVEIFPGQCFDSQYITSKTRRGRKMIHKSNCLMAGKPSFIYFTEEGRLRDFTPEECEILQTVPVEYTNYVSDIQRYRMIGNGWTVEVIMHIFSYLKPE